MTNAEALNNALLALDVDVDENSRPQSLGTGQAAAWRVTTGDGPAFVKSAHASLAAMFSAEADGLREIASSKTVRVPAVVASGESQGIAVLVTEWLQFGQGSLGAERRLGEQLADMHRYQADQFGWFRDNTIGQTKQVNIQGDNWIDFFIEHRLLFQVRLALNNGYDPSIADLGDRLARKLPTFFDDEPAPSLLHGDLWGGNWATCDAEPVIFDPAVYYGDRETDIAMTRLFGGFGAEFYRAYNEAWPMSPGHERRLELYQLYHVLNHLNLFGKSYLGRSIQMMKSLLA